MRIARLACQIERFARSTRHGRRGRIARGHRQPAAAERLRRAGRIRVLGGIEGIAAAPAARGSRLLHDRRRRSNLRLLIASLRLLIAGLRLRLLIARLRRRIGGLRLRLTIARSDLRRRHGRYTRLSRSWCANGASLELAQALLELAVTVLQLLVLPGELAQLVFEPLDPHFRIFVRLRACM